MQKLELKELIGVSPNIIDIKEQIEKIASTDITVLITGESGTGKAIIANNIHYYSGRKGSYEDFSCSVYEQTMIDSELFGHEKGAFTGAICMKKGRFELADHGTLFLDEIGIMPMYAQEKILKAIDEKKIRRVGGTVDIPVDVRIICATNADLGDLIKKGKFREDLYNRISQYEINIIPLRQRREDITPLISFFINKYPELKTELVISELFLEHLVNYNWPGNIRELENEINVLLKIKKQKLTVADIPDKIKDNMDELFERAIQNKQETKYLKLDEINSFVSEIREIYRRRAACDFIKNTNECMYWKFIKFVKSPFNTNVKEAEAKFKECIKRYCNDLLKSCNGNITKASQKSGFPGSTFRNRAGLGKSNPRESAENIS